MTLLKKIKNPNRTYKKALIAAIVTATTLSAHADGLQGSGELGYVNNDGNTISTNLYSSLSLDYIQPVYEIKSKLEANYQSENHTQTQERYLFDTQGNRFYNDDRTFYSYIGARFEKSRFEGIELDSTFSLGLGRELFKTDSNNLTAEIGIGYQTIDYLASYGGGDEQQTIGRLKGVFNQKISDSAEFTQDATVIYGSENTKVEATSAIKMKLVDKLQLSAGYKYRYNSAPADNALKLDTQTLLTLIYDF